MPIVVVCKCCKCGEEFHGIDPDHVKNIVPIRTIVDSVKNDRIDKFILCPMCAAQATDMMVTFCTGKITKVKGFLDGVGKLLDALL
jgi:hypothetical protein